MWVRDGFIATISPIIAERVRKSLSFGLFWWENKHDGAKKKKGFFVSVMDKRKKKRKMSPFFLPLFLNFFFYIPTFENSLTRKW
jgi:hypothetical protein